MTPPTGKRGPRRPDDRLTSEQILAIFGLTQEEYDALDSDGYVAAREAADLKRSAFEKYLREQLQAGFDKKFDGR